MRARGYRHIYEGPIQVMPSNAAAWPISSESVSRIYVNNAWIAASSTLSIPGNLRPFPVLSPSRVVSVAGVVVTALSKPLFWISIKRY